MLQFAVCDRRRRTHRTEPTCPLRPDRQIVIESRRPLRLGTRDERMALDAIMSVGDDVGGILARRAGPCRRTRSRRDRPRASADECLQRVRRAPPVDYRLEHGRRARERAAVRRDQAATRPDGAAQRASWRSSTRSARRCPRSSNTTRSSTPSATRSARSSATQDLTIAILEEESGLIHMPYWTENGVRDRDVPPMELGQGLTSRVLSTRRPVRTGSMAEAAELGGLVSGDLDAGMQESYLGVPIPSGDRVIGVLALTKHPSNAFSDADEQLVSTIASSMGVALENARLFDETKRLLAETNERAAELAIINSVQQSLAAKLDMESMYELVGEKIAETIHVLTMTIVTYDMERGETTTRFQIERGVRDRQGQVSPMSGFARYLVEHGEPILVNKRHHGLARGARADRCTHGRAPKSFVFAPLMLGGTSWWLPLAAERRSRGRVQRERSAPGRDAGGQPERRARERATVRRDAAAPGRDQRARGRAGDHQQRPGRRSPRSSTCSRCTTSSATRSTRSSTPRSLDHRRCTTLRPRADRYPYAIERGVRLPSTERPFSGFGTARSSSTRKPLLINDVEAWEAERGYEVLVAERRAAQGRSLFAPLDRRATQVFGRHLAPEHRPDERIQRSRRPPADDPGLSLSVALENARLFDETQRLLTETNERAAELAIINSVQQGPRREARHAVDVRPGRRQDPRDLRRPGRRHRPVTTRKPRLISYPYCDRARRPLVRRADSPLAGSRKIVLETRAADLGQRRRRVAGRARSPFRRSVSGEPAKSVLFAPMIVRRRRSSDASRSRTSTERTRSARATSGC